MRVAYVPRSEAISALKSAAPEDLLLEIIERGVTVMPPLNLLTKTAECPHCGVKGKVGKDFGVRVLGGTVRAQSWCRECRKNPKRMAKTSTRPSVRSEASGAPQTKEDLIALLKKSLSKTQLKALRKAVSAPMLSPGVTLKSNLRKVRFS